MILSAIPVLLCVYGVFLFFWFSASDPSTQQKLPAETTVQATVTPAETTCPATTEAEAPTVAADSLTARYAFVYHCESQSLLYSLGNQNDRVAPASLTKLFTAYVALQHLNPEDIVTVGEETTWIDPQSSVAAVKPGTALTVKMLIQGMMMQSGNDAAYAVAVAAGKSIAADTNATAQEAYDIFIQEVNRQAKLLGLSGTHFQNPDGIDADAHYTTPTDLIQIALLAAEEPIICTYANLDRDYVMYESGEDYTYRSTNLLLHPGSEYYCPAARGLKTGTTSKAGNCLLALFDCDGDTLLIGVLGCPTYQDRFADALILYHAFS